jgi:hypothetical protein
LFGNLMRAFDAKLYRGKRIRFSAFVRVEGAETDPSVNARLWVRVDREGKSMGFFDNMGANPITSSEWAEYSIEGDVDADAAALNIGVMLLGGGAALIDGAKFEVVGEANTFDMSPPRELTERGLENLVAFTKLLGYVRHFHPSDAAAALDWNLWTIAAMEDVEGAKEDAELASRLANIFVEVGPSIELSETQMQAWTPQEISRMCLNHAIDGTLAWDHRGFGQSASNGEWNIYRSERAEKDRAYGEVVLQQICEGVWCRVPIVVHTNKHTSIPRGNIAAAQARIDALQGFTGSGNDRRTRLADIALAWNIFQHFYPYWDVVETDWDAVLRDSLKRAATDKNESEFLETLKRMVHHLHDGHGGVFNPSLQQALQLPFDWDWAKGGETEWQLVVTHVPDENIVAVRRGDRVLSIDGVPLDEAYEAIGLTISAATDGWRRHRALDAWSYSNTTTLALDMEKPDGTQYSALVQRVPIGGGGTDYSEPRIDRIAEIKPGVYYVDIDRITMDDYEAWKDKLANAPAIIYDLRGYPRQVSPFFLYHHTDVPIRSGNWNVPIYTKPNQEDVRWETSWWPETKMEPRWTSNVAYITGGGAISYAESCMAMVEHYKLGEIVGANTAGTNGNVNPIQLPGGYGISWTGMKVTKHDGSQYHGVGVAPTVQCERTVAGIAAGRDEVLDKAVEVVEGGLPTRD